MKDRSKKRKLVINPLVSEAQRKWMWANHPEMAERWEKETPKRKLPKYKRARYKKGKKPTANAAKVRLDAVDPSRTLSLRRGLADDLDRRFNTLKKAVWDAVAVKDMLGLKERTKVTNSAAVPTIRQSTTYTCGAACFAAVCRYWGVDPMTEAAAARELGTSPRHGTSPRQLELAAGRAFLHCEVRRGMSLEELAGITSMGVPVLCCVQRHGTPEQEARLESGHWVAVTRIGGGNVHFMDPSVGMDSMYAGEFMLVWRDRGKLQGEEYVRLGVIISREPLGLTGNVFCPTGEGGGVDPSCSPGGKDSSSPSNWSEAWQRFAEVNKQLPNAVEMNLTGEQRRILMPGGRYLDIQLKTLRKLGGGKDDYAVRLDFGIEKKHVTFQAEGLQPGSVDFMRLVKKAARMYHDAGLKLLVVPSDDKREAAYTRTLSSMGMKLERREGAQGQVWNFSSKRDDGQVENASRYLSPKQFHDWLEKQGKKFVVNPATEKEIRKYLGAAHSKGVARVYQEADRDLTADEGYKAGAKDQFLKGVAGKSRARRLVADSAYADLQKAVDDMMDQVDMVVQQGLKKGLTPKQLASDILKRVDGVGAYRARLIARTKVVEAHAEGQLDALEELGAPGVGVMVENSPDGNVCPDCAALAGIVYTVAEARGLIPVHPNCLCALVMVGMSPRQRKAWRVGKRPVRNVFCPTGEGGGVDPSCSPGGKDGDKPPEGKPTKEDWIKWNDKGWSWGEHGWEPPYIPPQASEHVSPEIHAKATEHLSDDGRRTIALAHSWETTKPWNVTKERMEVNPPEGFALMKREHGEEAHFQGGRIYLSSKFFSLPAEARRHIVYHELGHQLADTMTADGTSFQLHDAGVIPAKHDMGSGTGGGHNDEEALADAYAILHTDLPWLRKHYPKLEKPVVDRARALGMPLPIGVMNAEFKQTSDRGYVSEDWQDVRHLSRHNSGTSSDGGSRSVQERLEHLEVSRGLRGSGALRQTDSDLRRSYGNQSVGNSLSSRREIGTEWEDFQP